MTGGEIKQKKGCCTRRTVGIVGTDYFHHCNLKDENFQLEHAPKLWLLCLWGALEGAKGFLDRQERQAEEKQWQRAEGGVPKKKRTALLARCGQGEWPSNRFRTRPRWRGAATPCVRGPSMQRGGGDTPLALGAGCWMLRSYRASGICMAPHPSSARSVSATPRPSAAGSGRHPGWTAAEAGGRGPRRPTWLRLEEAPCGGRLAAVMVPVHQGRREAWDVRVAAAAAGPRGRQTAWRGGRRRRWAGSRTRQRG